MRTAYVEQHSANEPILAVALELAKASWKVALSDARRNPRLKTVDAPQPLARLEQVLLQIEQARVLWELPAQVRVVELYEAGQDGFWLQRALQARGVETLIIDPASLLMERRARHFRSRRQVGACVGLVPSPYASGTLHADQGISKQGNPRVRALLIELAWLWLRYQPDSALSQWFARKAGGDCRRSRRVAIVALARRLVIALWRYLEQGVLPPGASLKAAP